MPSPITKAGQFSSSNSNTNNASSGGVGLVAKGVGLVVMGVAITATESVALSVNCWILVVDIMLIGVASGVVLLGLFLLCIPVVLV